MTFEDLEAWKEARTLVNDVYCLTRHSGLTRDYGLSSQLQRAAVSIMANISEGFERLHVQEKLQFYNTARASAGETRALLYVVEDNYPELADKARQARCQTVKAGSLLTGLLRSTQRRKACPS